MSFRILHDGGIEEGFKSFDAADRWGRANLPDGTWWIETPNGTCC